MDEKYKKAIKAGLIGAVLIVIIHLLVDLIFYWAATKPSLKQWLGQQMSGSPPAAPGITNVPPEALIAGFALILGVLLIYVMFLLTGAIAAFLTARTVKGVADIIVVGIIAGATAQIVETPFSLFVMLLMKLYMPGYEEPMSSIWPWLSGQLLLNYGETLVIAIILSAIAALACGLLLRATGKNTASA